MNPKRIKQYDSIIFKCQYKDDTGAPLSVEGLSIQSEIRKQSGDLVTRLNVRVNDAAAGVFVLTPEADALPYGTHLVDVLFIKHGARVASDTFTVTIEPAVTRPENLKWQS